MKKNQILIVFFFLIIASALPALIGWIISNSSFRYSGVVFNPLDGYTYLAKMEIGKSGEWLFSLPYTAQTGEGRLLYPFYIAFGHFFQISGISLPFGFNLLRILSYGCLIFALIKLAQHLFPDDKTNSRLTLLLLAAGGGLGWILLPFGKFGADFWVSEAFPFLSGLANPHFPLALVIMVFTLWMTKKPVTILNGIGYSLLGLSLSILSPFGFVLSSIILFLGWVWEKLEKKQSFFLSVLIFILTGLPYSIYQYWAVSSTPQLAAWTAQNQTLTPAIWDIVLTFSPWLILVIIGWRFLYAQRNDPVIRRLILWVVIGLVMTIVPFNLQRRFLIGLSIPVTCLGLLVLPVVAENLKFSARKLRTICTVLALPTPFLLLMMVSVSIGARTPLYFYQTDELSAIQWLSRQGDGKSLVLASEQTGLLIPAASRLRVLYGHPFESLDAVNEKAEMANFFAGKQYPEAEKNYLAQKQVDWIFYGPREQEMGSPGILKGLDPQMQFGDVMIFNAAELLK